MKNDSETQSDSISMSQSQSNNPVAQSLTAEQSPILRDMKKQKIVAKASIKNLKKEVMIKKGLRDSGSQQMLPSTKAINLIGSPSRKTNLLSELKRMNSDNLASKEVPSHDEVSNDQKNFDLHVPEKDLTTPRTPGTQVNSKNLGSSVTESKPSVTASGVQQKIDFQFHKNANQRLRERLDNLKARQNFFDANASDLLGSNLKQITSSGKNEDVVSKNILPESRNQTEPSETTNVQGYQQKLVVPQTPVSAFRGTQLESMLGSRFSSPKTNLNFYNKVSNKSYGAIKQLDLSARFNEQPVSGIVTKEISINPVQLELTPRQNIISSFPLSQQLQSRENSSQKNLNLIGLGFRQRTIDESPAQDQQSLKPSNNTPYNPITPGRVLVIQNQLGDEIRELEGRGFTSPSPGVKKFTTNANEDNNRNFNFYDTSSSPKLERFDLRDNNGSKIDVAFSNAQLRNSYSAFEPPSNSSASKLPLHSNPIAFKYGERVHDRTGTIEPSERGFMSVTGVNPMIADTRSYQSITPTLPTQIQSPDYNYDLSVKSIQVPQGNVFGSEQNFGFGNRLTDNSSLNILQSRLNSEQKSKNFNRVSRFNDSSLGSIQFGSGRKFQNIEKQATGLPQNKGDEGYTPDPDPTSFGHSKTQSISGNFRSDQGFLLNAQGQPSKTLLHKGFGTATGSNYATLRKEQTSYLNQSMPFNVFGKDQRISNFERATLPTQGSSGNYLDLSSQRTAGSQQGKSNQISRPNAANGLATSTNFSANRSPQSTQRSNKVLAYGESVNSLQRTLKGKSANRLTEKRPRFGLGGLLN